MNKALKSWQKETNKLAQEFINKYFDGFEDWEWIDDDVGGTLEVGDYYFNLDRMVTALRYKATQKQLFDYYDMQLEMGLNEKAFKKRTLFSFANYLRYPETFVIEFVDGEGFNFRINK